MILGSKTIERNNCVEKNLRTWRKQAATTKNMSIKRRNEKQTKNGEKTRKPRNKRRVNKKKNHQTSNQAVFVTGLLAPVVSWNLLETLHIFLKKLTAHMYAGEMGSCHSYGMVLFSTFDCRALRSRAMFFFVQLLVFVCGALAGTTSSFNGLAPSWPSAFSADLMQINSLAMPPFDSFFPPLPVRETFVFRHSFPDMFEASFLRPRCRASTSGAQSRCGKFVSFSILLHRLFVGF